MRPSPHTESRRILLFCAAVLIVFTLITFVLTKRAAAEVLTLSQGLKLATEQSRLIRIAEKDEEISRADALVQRAKLYPELNAAASETALGKQPRALFGSQTVPVSERDFLKYSITIQHTLYDFRRNASLYEASKAILKTKTIDMERVRNLVALEFGLTYFDLLEAAKMVNVAQRETERLDVHLRDARNFYEEGVITKNDLLQAQVRISDAQQRLSLARSAESINASRLNRILARPLDLPIEPSDSFIRELKGLSVDLLRTDTHQAWSLAEKQRPEIRIADETYRALGLEERSRKADYFPKIVAQGGYDYTQNRYMQPQGNWQVTLGLSLNVFNGFATRAQIEKLEAQKARLLEQKDNLIDQIRLELTQAIIHSRTSDERVAVTKDAVLQAEENLRINRVRYEEGVGTATDVLDAVALLTTSETNYYRAVYDLSRAEAAVLYSMGVDLTTVYQ